jgi:hypothetical protein
LKLTQNYIISAKSIAGNKEMPILGREIKKSALIKIKKPGLTFMG